MHENIEYIYSIILKHLCTQQFIYSFIYLYNVLVKTSRLLPVRLEFASRSQNSQDSLITKQLFTLFSKMMVYVWCVVVCGVLRVTALPIDRAIISCKIFFPGR